MAKISQKTVDEILHTADIVEVISGYVNLTPSGSGYKGLCPFHSEKTPSFNVSKEKGIFKCFGCHESGNVVSFVQKYKNISYPEALLQLADMYHIPVETDGIEAPRNPFTRLYDLMGKVNQLYEISLTNFEKGRAALEYVKNRGLDLSTIQYFELGYADSSTNDLYHQLKEEFEPVELMEVGLIKKTDQNYVDLFRNRLMFPLHNEQGNIIGFSGREIQGSSDMKYINSPQTKIFTKGEVLYNLHRAVPFIAREKRIVLFEGYFDVISAHMAGIKEGVCSMGTSLTQTQAEIIKKHTNKVLICYDGDKAGFEAIHKAIPILQNVSLEVSICLLPDKLDPDEFVKKFSKEAFKDFLDRNQIDPFEFQYEYMKRQVDFNKPSQIENFKLRIFEMIARTNSDLLKNIYVTKLAKDIGVDVAVIESDIHHYQITKFIKQKKQIKDEKIVLKATTNKCISAERRLLIYYLENNEYRRKIISELGRNFCKDDFGVKILFYSEDYEKKSPEQNITEQVISAMQANDQEMAKSRLDAKNEPYSDEDLDFLIHTKKICLIEGDIAERVVSKNVLIKKLEDDSLQEEDRKVLSKEMIRISNEIRELKSQIEALRKEILCKKKKS